MFSLKNITVRQFLKSEEYFTYDSVLRHNKGESIFNGKKFDIYQQSYTNVKYCMKLLNNINNFDTIIELFEIICDSKSEDVYNATVLDYYKARNYIIEVFKKINDNERKLAQSSTGTDVRKWQIAGGEKLSIYDSVLPLDQLAQRYGCNPFELGKKPYSEIFYLIAMTTTINEVNYNYNKQ